MMRWAIFGAVLVLIVGAAFAAVPMPDKHFNYRPDPGCYSPLRHQIEGRLVWLGIKTPAEAAIQRAFDCWDTTASRGS